MKPPVFSPSRETAVSALKGLAILGVVLHHISNRRTDVEASAWLHLLSMLSDWCVFAFFLVAGYLQALSDSRREKSFLEFAVVRARRLLVPFLLFILVYAVIWQFVQALGLHGIGDRVPRSFTLKVEHSLWPVMFPVAEQLYYFPLLFGVSLVVILARAIAGPVAVGVVATAAFVLGIILFSSAFTGFQMAVFCWGCFYYGFGYTLFSVREKTQTRRALVVICTLILLATCGEFGVLKAIPLWLLAEASTLGLTRLPLLERLGEASGTIYAYHSPFIVQPLALAVALLPGAPAQFVGALAAVALTAAICCAFYYFLKDTRAKVLLI